MGARFVPEPTHPLLSPQAKGVIENNPEALAVYAEEAESLLGITASSAVSEENETLVTSAVARQISTLVEFDPESILVQSSSRGSRSVTYRESVLPVNPISRRIIEMLGIARRSSAYRTLSSYRGRTLTPEMLLPDSTEIRS